MRRWLALAGIAGGTALTLGILSKSRAASAFSPPQGYKELAALAQHVDPYIHGFSKFAVAVAHNESRGNSQAMNDSPSERGAACRGYERQADGKFRDNPYPKADWCWGSGGWFGLLPSTGLGAPGFENLDPLLVLDAEAQVAMYADFVRRVVQNNWNEIPEEHRNWLTVRRFAAGRTVGFDWNEERVLSSDRDGVPRARKVRLKFARSLRAMGIPESFMYKRVRVKNWPGAIQLWEILR